MSLIPPIIKIENYLQVIKAAEYCQSYFIAILYGEMYAFNPIPPYPALFNDIKSNDELVSILRKAYRSVGSFDTKNFFTDPISNREDYLNANNTYVTLLLEQEVHKSEQISSTLMDVGLYSLALASCSEDDPARYECAWRMGQWSLIDNEENLKENAEANFERYHYNCLKSLHQEDPVTLKVMADKARKAVVQMLKNTSVQCPNSLYKPFNMLERIQQLEDFCKIRLERGDYKNLLDKWTDMDELPIADFSLEELKVAQRLCLLEESGIVAKRNWVSTIREQLISNLINIALKTKNDRAAIRYTALSNLLNISEQCMGKILIAQAEIAWNQGDAVSAKAFLNKAITSNDSIAKVIAYRKLGEYTSEAVTNSPSEVFDAFFKKSVNVLENYAKNNNRYDNMRKGIYENDKIGENLKQNVIVYEIIARFYDKECVNVINDMKGKDYQRRKETHRKLVIKKQELENSTSASSLGHSLNELKKARSTLEKECKFDENYFKQTNAKRNLYANMSITYYIEHCTLSPEVQNLNVFRLVSLWLTNKHVSRFTLILFLFNLNKRLNELRYQ